MNRRPRCRHRAFTLLAASWCLIIAACGDAASIPGDEQAAATTASSSPAAPGPTTTSTEPDNAPGPVEDGEPGDGAETTIAWTSCQSLDCGTVIVPLDYAEPDGETIEIAIARRSATGERRGSIFINPGGPGASGVDYVQAFTFTPEIMAEYDVIGFDPRGIGLSAPIACELDRSQGPQPDYSPDDADERSELDDLASGFARDCEAQGGELLANVDTETVARDLDRLRIAVGDEKLHYYGFSFGTLIGQVYADLFPERIDHLVLDGVVDPTKSLEDLLRQQAGAFEHSFDLLDQACETELDCPPGGAAAAFDRVLAKIELEGPVGGVGPSEVEAAALVALYDEAYWPTLTTALRSAEAGDFALIEILSDLFTSTVDFGAYAAVECSDSPHPIGQADWDAFADELSESAPRFGAWIANELRTCAYWPVDPQPPRTYVLAPGADPIVVISTTNDPATPLANAEVVAQELESGRLVVVEGDRHTAYGLNACVDDLITAYFVDDEAPADGSTC